MSAPSRRGGSVLIETAMVLIFVLLPLTVGVIQYFIVFGAANAVTQITRQGGRYAAVFARKNAGETPIPAAGSPGCPTAPCADAYIISRIKQEAAVVNLNPNDVSVTITPAFASRQQYQAVTVTVTYNMSKKKFSPLPVPATYVRSATTMLE
ncbi:MAG TPA: TadE family protein [Abditibacteriaceae bacterium]